MGTLLNQNEQDNAESGGVSGEKKDWNTSKDWRAHGKMLWHGRARQQQQASCAVAANEIGDLEWVGGWHDLHL